MGSRNGNWQGVLSVECWIEGAGWSAFSFFDFFICLRDGAVYAVV